jgi:hypothetical protein
VTDGNGTERTAAEKLIERGIIAPTEQTGRFGSSSLTRERSLEGYMKAGGRPRWMERLMQIERGTAAEQLRLGAAHDALREAFSGDPAGFAREWRATVEAWRFPGELNDLIEQHNAWYPIERDLPMDPRTGDYIRVHGRSYRRPLLDAAWALEQFPAG